MKHVRNGLFATVGLAFFSLTLLGQPANPIVELKPARLKVLLPADARLSIDDSPTRSSGGERMFVTPPLPPGKDFTYTLKWTYRVKNETIVRMILATCRAGEETTLDLRPGSKDNVSSRISYVPTPDLVVEKMLELGEVTARDVVFDLGCGDGRIVALAAQKRGAHGVGIDIDPERIRDSHVTVKKAGVEKLVEIRQADALKVPDLGRASVVTTYMLYEFQKKLAPILKKELKPGSRIVAHDFEFPDWPPEKTVKLQGPDREHVLYLYRIGGKSSQ